MDEVKRFEDKELRGRILKALDYEYPRSISKKMLVHALQSARYTCSKSHLDAHLSYLQEKGYIKVEYVGVEKLDFGRNMVTLTAKGKDLVEGNIDNDPGVMLYG